MVAIGKSDFCDEAVFVIFEADETHVKPQHDITAHINITDDNINEADQVFILHLRVQHKHMNGRVVLQQRPSTLCRIMDNDRTLFPQACR